MAVSITVVDRASPRLEAMLQALPRLMPRAGAAVHRLVQDHLFSRDSKPNKNGWPSQHFYSSAAKSATWKADATSATISINKQGFRLRVEGGTIKPVNVTYLTIPARSEAYGKRAREFGNLKMQFGRRSDGTIGPVALVSGAGGATRKVFARRQASGSERPVAGAEEGVVMFWLVREVHQEADPTVIPTHEQINETAMKAIHDGFALLQSRGAA